MHPLLHCIISLENEMYYFASLKVMCLFFSDNFSKLSLILVFRSFTTVWSGRVFFGGGVVFILLEICRVSWICGLMSFTNTVKFAIHNSSSVASEQVILLKWVQLNVFRPLHHIPYSLMLFSVLSIFPPTPTPVPSFRLSIFCPFNFQFTNPVFCYI